MKAVNRLRARDLLASVGLLALGGCHPSTPSMEPLPSEARLFHAQASIYSQPTRLIVRDSTQWPEVWRTVTDASPSVGPARPDIDFTREMVVVAAAGTRPGGDEISIDSVAERSGMLRVVVTTQQLCQGTFWTGNPIDVVRVPRVEGRVQFLERVGRTQRCAAVAEESHAR
jgi:hypothetical protein